MSTRHGHHVGMTEEIGGLGVGAKDPRERIRGWVHVTVTVAFAEVPARTSQSFCRNVVEECFECRGLLVCVVVLFVAKDSVHREDEGSHSLHDFLGIRVHAAVQSPLL